jgi:hypothetical protein
MSSASRRILSLSCPLLLLAGAWLGCATSSHDRDGRYRREPYYDPYYGSPGYYPAYPSGHGDYHPPLERHQTREKQALERDQEREREALAREQKSERKEQKQTGEWDQQDKREQKSERKELKREQEREDRRLRKHQREEWEDWYDPHRH